MSCRKVILKYFYKNCSGQPNNGQTDIDRVNKNVLKLSIYQLIIYVINTLKIFLEEKLLIVGFRSGYLLNLTLEDTFNINVTDLFYLGFYEGPGNRMSTA